jgi:signal transduction histidine kinase
MVEGTPIEAQNAAYNTVQQQRISDIELQAQNVAPPPEEIPLGGLDFSYLSAASLQLSSQLDTRIRIVDTGGEVLVDSHQEGGGTGLAGDPLVMEALAGRYASRTDREGREPEMHVAQPIFVEGRLSGVVYLSQPLRDVVVVMQDLRIRWLASTVIALALSGVAGLLLSRAIARPVSRLTEAAGAVAQGQLDQQVPVGSRDELGRLSETFNEMTDRLKAARQMQTDFVANVSHELRTPLTAVKGLVETLRDGAVNDPEVRDRFLETVEDETDRLTRLVNDLLILSRADSQALNLQRERLDMVELVEATVARMAPQAEAQGLALRVGAEPGGAPALADPDRMEQVLVNLLDNAIKYSRPGGQVTVEVGSAQDRGVQVQIRDEGMGIPAEDLARVGERFYRADKARSRTKGGSGLGLAIARALVEAHGGELRLESHEGRGTTVVLTLPAAETG